MVRPLTTNAVEVQVASAASDPRERSGAAGPYRKKEDTIIREESIAARWFGKVDR